MQCEPYLDIIRPLFSSMDAENEHQRVLHQQHQQHQHHSHLGMCWMALRCMHVLMAVQGQIGSTWVCWTMLWTSDCSCRTRTLGSRDGLRGLPTSKIR